jgi:hypothetical protein
MFREILCSSIRMTPAKNNPPLMQALNDKVKFRVLTRLPSVVRGT